MAFRFTLAGVLRLRASFEKFEHLRLMAIAATIVRVRAEMDAIAKEVAVARYRVQQMLAGGTFSGEILFEKASERLRAERLRVLEMKLVDLKKKEEAQRAVYMMARQKLEIVESLRERQLSAYRQEQARREQQGLDELFLLRLGRNDPDED